MTKTYHVIHRNIDGALVDREEGYPELKLEMRPIGIALDPPDQGRELHLTIGRTKTILTNDGLDELIEFLQEDPRS